MALPCRLLSVLPLALLLSAPLAAVEPPSPARTAAKVDAALAPASPATTVANDETFLRRVTLDLTGKLPDPEALRRFVADPSPDKRARAIDALPATEAYAVNCARHCRHTLPYHTPPRPNHLRCNLLDHRPPPPPPR